MKRTIHIPTLLACAASAALAVACGSDPDGGTPAPDPSDRAIAWKPSLETAGRPASRALVGSDPEAGDISLQTACSPGGRTIDLYAFYSEAEATTAGENIFSPDTFLSYEPGASAWTTNKTYYWFIGGRYRFRAIYPHLESLPISENSSQRLYLTNINTTTMQEDICVAQTDVDTAAPGFNPEEAVQLTLYHTFAAVRFLFKAEYEVDDRLTSCLLRNTAATEGDRFATHAGLSYDPTAKPTVADWSPGYRPTDHPFYEWHDAPGIPFSMTTTATAYTPSEGTTTGKAFTGNAGWLLIIPQSAKMLQLNFTTERSGEAIYQVTIPECTYEPGKRYTYTVKVTPANLTLTLEIDDWNVLNSSHEIEF